MRFPMGFEWTKGFFTYEVVGYNSDAEKPYIVRFGYSLDEEQLIYLTEGELEVMSGL